MKKVRIFTIIIVIIISLTLSVTSFASTENMSDNSTKNSDLIIGDAITKNSEVTEKNNMKARTTESYNPYQIYNVYVKGTSNYSYAYEVLDIVNQERKNQGLDPLKMDESLLDSAMIRAAETVIYWDHIRPNATECFSINPGKMNGENIAIGWGHGNATPESVMEGWMNSPGHRANILTESFNSIGVGHIVVDGVNYWVQCFGEGEAVEPTKKQTGSVTRTNKVEVVDAAIWLSTKYTSDVTIRVGEQTSRQLYTNNTLFNIAIENNSANWTSSNEKVAKVDSYGKVTAVGVGDATITASIGAETISYKLHVLLPFTDVNKSDWYYNAIEYTYQNGIISGATDTEFRPSAKITRGMIVTILWRMEGSPKVTGVEDFTDVTGQYYYDAVRWAAKNGVVNGYGDGRFGPNANITREQLATILCNYAKYKKKNTNVTVDISKYKDWNKVSSYARASMQWAIKTGVVTGKENGTKVDPQGTATRGEAACMIYNYCTKIK